MRLRVVAMLRHTRAGQIDRRGDFAPELPIEVGRRLGQIDPRVRKGAEIVIDRDGPAEEEDAQPEHARERPMSGGVVRRERDGPSEQLDGAIVIQVVGQLYSLPAQIPAGFLSGLCCNGQGRTYR